MASSNSGENSETIASDRVSAAILAKVLEERDKERRAEAKFCIDVGTQTHGYFLEWFTLLTYLLAIIRPQIHLKVLLRQL